MSLENPKQNNSSESMEHDVPVFSQQPDEPSLEIKRYDTDTHEDNSAYSIESLLKKYDTKNKELHAEFLKIQTYLEAKKEVPSIARDLITLLTTTPASAITISEQERELAKYEKIIDSFESNGIPKDMYQNTKKAWNTLNDTISSMTKIQSVAKNSPRSN